jgi:hypothetical protein
MEHFNEAKVVWSLAEWEPDEEKLRALVDEVIGLLDRALAGQLDSLAQAACYHIRGQVRAARVCSPPTDCCRCYPAPTECCGGCGGCGCSCGGGGGGGSSSGAESALRVRLRGCRPVQCFAKLGRDEEAKQELKRGLKLRKIPHAQRQLVEVEARLAARERAESAALRKQRQHKYCCFCVPRCSRGPFKPAVVRR